MYIVDPGETKLVEAASDPIGLKIALVYDAQPDGQILKYQRWAIKNDKVLTITGLKNEEISTVAGELSSCISWIFFKIYFEMFR